jgi:hypothetical protein
MIRALTIRFAIMGVGLCVLVVLVNVLHASPPLAMGSLMVYLLGGTLIVGNYCIAHEDEIPTRAQRRRRRHR